MQRIIEHLTSMFANVHNITDLHMVALLRGDGDGAPFVGTRFFLMAPSADAPKAFAVGPAKYAPRPAMPCTPPNGRTSARTLRLPYSARCLHQPCTTPTRQPSAAQTVPSI
jgi:hypothetical protein